MGKSIAAKDQVASLFASDVDAEISEARFVDDFDYGGTREPVSALRVTFKVEDLDDPVVQHYTMGDKNLPVDDGLGYDGPGIGESTNAGKFVRALIDAGFDDDLLAEGDISCIEGLFVHIVQQAQPLAKNAEKGAKPRTLLVVNEIHDEKPKAKAGAKAAPKGAAKVAAPAAKGKGNKAKVEEKTIEAIVAIVDEAGGPIALSKLSTLLFKAHKTDADLKAMQELATDTDWLTEREEFSFDGTKVSAAE